jgi:16S rRNA (cytosine967-C5)-methyltransferase
MSPVTHRSRHPRVDRVRENAARLLHRHASSKANIEDLVAAFDASESGGASWDYVERRRLREIVYGCVRLRDRYDFLLRALSKTAGAPDPRVRAVLHCALHEICEMRSQDFAVVDQAVEITRRLQRTSATGFVNAVLRRVLREGVDSFFEPARARPVDYAVTWWSHPRWMVERWAELLGPEETLALCECNDRRPLLHLRCPPGTRDAVQKRLAALEWEAAAIDFAPDALELRTRVPAALALEKAGEGVVLQDAAAQLVAPLVAETEPAEVLDLCAAPGGKTSHLAQLLPGSRITAADLSSERLATLESGLGRVGLRERVRCRQVDGRATGWESGRFDAVLVDAPCTGTGVLARRQEARYRRSPEDLETLPEIQIALLEEALRLVRPQGVVVYSTCSLEPEENDAVVDTVLEKSPGVEEIGVGSSIRDGLQRSGRMQVWPQRHGCDGAFAARLRRT